MAQKGAGSSCHASPSADILALAEIVIWSIGQVPTQNSKENPRKPRHNQKEQHNPSEQTDTQLINNEDARAFIDKSINRIISDKISTKERILLLEKLSKVDDSNYISIVGSDRAREFFLVVSFCGLAIVLRALLEGLDGNSQSMRAFWLNIDTVLFLITQTIKAPSEPQRRAFWFSVVGGLNALLCVCMSVTLTISFMAFPEAGGPILLISGACSLLYSLLLCSVLIHPVLLLNSNIIVFADYLLITYCVQFAAGWLARHASLTGFQIPMLTANMMFIGFIIYINSNANKWLNSIQRIALQTIRPERLMYALRKAYSDIEDHRGALDIIQELEKMGKYGIIVHIEKQISEKYRSAHSEAMKKTIAVMVSIFMVTLGAAYEGLVQSSAPYASVKNKICTEYKWLCEQPEKPQQ